MPESRQHADSVYEQNPPMLSQFEYDILRRMLDDCDTRRICDELGISAVTVKITVESIMQRLGTKTVAGTAARAFRLGIIA